MNQLNQGVLAMKTGFVFLCLVLLFRLSNGIYNPLHVSKRVINGNIPTAEEFPWAVQIMGQNPTNKNIIGYCGATLITKEWLVTAAHCFDVEDSYGRKVANTNPKNWHINAGSILVDFGKTIQDHAEEVPEFGRPNNLPSHDNILDEFAGFTEFLQKELQRYQNMYNNLFGRVSYDSRHNVYKRKMRMRQSSRQQQHFHITKIFVHPRYTPSDIEYDIALMKLSEPVVDNPIVKPVKVTVPKNRGEVWPPVNAQCALVGWGCTEAGGGPNNMGQLFQSNVISHNQCNQLYRNGAGLNWDHEYCALATRTGQGICPGDSGSGLVCKTANGDWNLAGIASATHRTMPSKYPGLFTRTAYFFDWMVHTLKNN